MVLSSIFSFISSHIFFLFYLFTVFLTTAMLDFRCIVKCISPTILIRAVHVLRYSTVFGSLYSKAKNLQITYITYQF